MFVLLNCSFYYIETMRLITNDYTPNLTRLKIKTLGYTGRSNKDRLVQITANKQIKYFSVSSPNIVDSDRFVA